MSARAFFFTKIQDDAEGRDYETWAAAIDYPFTRSQDSVERYEIMRVRSAGPVQPPVAYEYVELIEVADTEAFPGVFEQPEAKPIITKLRTFISPDPLGLVGAQVLLSGAPAGERAPVRSVVALKLASGVERSDFEAHLSAGALRAMLDDAEISRAEVVAIGGRYKRSEPAPLDYLVILDGDPAAPEVGDLPASAHALMAADLVDPDGSQAFVGALIEHFAAAS